MPNESYVLDRFEDNDWAVLERPGGETFHIPSRWLPEGAREGAVVRVETYPIAEGQQVLELSLDPDETARRLEDAKARREGLPKGPSGDFDL